VHGLLKIQMAFINGAHRERSIQGALSPADTAYGACETTRLQRQSQGAAQSPAPTMVTIPKFGFTDPPVLPQSPPEA